MLRVPVIIIMNPKIMTIPSLDSPRKSATPEPNFLCQKLPNSSKGKNSSKLGQNL